MNQGWPKWSGMETGFQPSICSWVFDMGNNLYVKRDEPRSAATGRPAGDMPNICGYHTRHLRLKNIRKRFVALLFNFDPWTKSAKTRLNKAKQG
jgi:hypothetical protein